VGLHIFGGLWGGLPPIVGSARVGFNLGGYGG